MESRFPYTKTENRMAEEAAERQRNRTKQQSSRYPKGPFWSFLVQCRKCHLMESIDARKNGVPKGLQLELGGRIVSDGRGGLMHRPAWLCGGKVDVFGTYPSGYDKLY